MNCSGFLHSVTGDEKPMVPFPIKTFVFFTLVILAISTCFAQSAPAQRASDNPETLAVLPFELHNVSSEEGLILTRRFAEVVREANRFDVMLTDSVVESESMKDARALAERGRALGVRKIVHVSVVHREKLYIFQIRLVNVNDATLLYAERVDHKGEFGSFLSDVIPEQARKLTLAHLDAKTPWAKAAFLFGGCLGAILWIMWHLRRKGRQQGRSPSSNKTAREEDGLLS
jgi:TolB-like protein